MLRYWFATIMDGDWFSLQIGASLHVSHASFRGIELRCGISDCRSFDSLSPTKLESISR
jgi:hypothetical protein